MTYCQMSLHDDCEVGTLFWLPGGLSEPKRGKHLTNKPEIQLEKKFQY